jgi:hypothetical protein
MAVPSEYLEVHPQVLNFAKARNLADAEACGDQHRNGAAVFGLQDRTLRRTGRLT